MKCGSQYGYVFFMCYRKAEWLGNDNRKTMIKVQTTEQILPFKRGAFGKSRKKGGSLRTIKKYVDIN
jgi:hypothetical protein